MSSDRGGVRVRVVNRAEPRPEFDPWYLTTVPGALKISKAISSLVAFVCVVMINGMFGGTYFVAFIAVIGFTFSLILLIMYLFNLVQLIGCNWRMTELVFDGLWVAMFLISTALMVFSAVRWTAYSAPWGAAAFFCLVAAVIHAVDFVLRYRSRQAHGRTLNQGAYKPGQPAPPKPERQPLSQQPPPPPYTPPRGPPPSGAYTPAPAPYTPPRGPLPAGAYTPAPYPPHMGPPPAGAYTPAPAPYPPHMGPPPAGAYTPAPAPYPPPMGPPPAGAYTPTPAPSTPQESYPSLPSRGPPNPQNPPSNRQPPLPRKQGPVRTFI